MSPLCGMVLYICVVFIPMYEAPWAPLQAGIHYIMAWFSQTVYNS